MSVSIVTPWLEHPEFADAYQSAVQGADEIAIVNTGCSLDVLRRLDQFASGFVDYPHAGHNYGHWCNTGYAAVTGDIVIFLNNDIRADGDWLARVRDEVKDGALYGPELAAQVVDGLQVPFLSGWCLAATKKTWEALRFLLHFQPDELQERASGPWDTHAYPAAGYWEDNDVSFRAMQAGIRLVQTDWPIVHLDGGNGTAKHRKEYYADVERNKATFQAMVRRAMEVQHAAV